MWRIKRNFGTAVMPPFVSNLYRDGEAGDYWEISDLAYLFQDTAGSVAAALDQPVGFVKGRRGIHNLVAPSDAARPTLRRANGKYYLELDGINDQLEVPGSTNLFKYLHDGSGGSLWAIAAAPAGANPRIIGTVDTSGTTGAMLYRFGLGIDCLVRNASANVISGASFPTTSDWPSDQVSLISMSYKTQTGNDSAGYIDGVPELSLAELTSPSSGSAEGNLRILVNPASGIVTKIFGVGVVSRELSPAEHRTLWDTYDNDLNFLIDIADTDTVADGFEVNGQSYISQTISPLNIDPDYWHGGPGTDQPLSLTNKNFTLRHRNKVVMRTIGLNSESDNITDIVGLDIDSPDPTFKGGGINIARVALVVRRLLQEGAVQPTRMQISVNHAIPGRLWDELKPGAIVIDALGITNHPWEVGISMRESARSILTHYGRTIAWRGIVWIDNEMDMAQLLDMQATYNALDLNGDGLPVPIFTDLASLENKAGLQRYPDDRQNQIDFSNNQAQVYCVGPNYQEPTGDTIHHTARGYCKLGERLGRVMWEVLDNGNNWSHLQIDTDTLIIDGDYTVFSTTDVEGTGLLSVDTTYVEEAPQYGLALTRGGIDIPMTSLIDFSISGLEVRAKWSSTPLPGDKLSYAWQQLAADQPSLPGGHGDIWGNLKQAGLIDSPIYTGQKIDSWLGDFQETL